MQAPGRQAKLSLTCVISHDTHLYPFADGLNKVDDNYIPRKWQRWEMTSGSLLLTTYYIISTQTQAWDKAQSCILNITC